MNIGRNPPHLRLRSTHFQRSQPEPARAAPYELIPFAFGSYLGEWIRTLAAIRALDVSAIIPGHGAVQHDWRYLDQVSTLLTSTLEQTRAAVAAGKSLDSTRAAVNPNAQSALFTGTSVLLTRSFRNFSVLPAVERAYLEVRGELDRKSTP